jgi:hypothetical protein
VRAEGLEPPRDYAHQDLNLARLPIPPRPRHVIVARFRVTSLRQNGCVTPSITDELLDQTHRWASLSQWERGEVGRGLRRLGLSYGEIRGLIPVPKATLSYWCRDIELSGVQKAAIKSRTGSPLGVPRNTQWRRREQVELLRSEAMAEVPTLLRNSIWLAGVMLYWAEGSKSKRSLEIVNSDPELLRIFVAWVRTFLEPEPRFTLMLHLHEENDEAAAKSVWASALGFDEPEWHKTYIKPSGTGHRKNRLTCGVCRVRLRRSADAFVRVMAWIEGLRGRLT